MSEWDDWLTTTPAWQNPLSTEYQDGIRTEEDYLNRNQLMGYCEHCDEWYQFERGNGSEDCPKCSGKYSHRHGYQLTSVRSFNPATKRKRYKKK